MSGTITQKEALSAILKVYNVLAENRHIKVGLLAGQASSVCPPYPRFTVTKGLHLHQFCACHAYPLLSTHPMTVPQWQRVFLLEKATIGVLCNKV